MHCCVIVQILLSGPRGAGGPWKRLCMSQSGPLSFSYLFGGTTFILMTGSVAAPAATRSPRSQLTNVQCVIHYRLSVVLWGGGIN